MIQKNYKEIARIIKEEYCNSFTVDRWRNLVCKLAYYFEREANKVLVIKYGGHKIKKAVFNRQQFLKDCGVE